MKAFFSQEEFFWFSVHSKLLQVLTEVAVTDFPQDCNGSEVPNNEGNKQQA